MLENDTERQNNTFVAWQQMAQHFGLSDQLSPDIQPGTATLKNLPPSASGAIVLPKVGIGPTESEDELRESLRRFITEWRPLLGATPNQLSLVERTDLPSGEKVARYEQHPFRFPLRGNFGELVIRFRADRRVTGVSSTCLTEVDRLQSQLAGLSPRISADEAAALLKGQPVAAPTGTISPVLILPQTSLIEVRQLVAYVTEQKSPKTGLEVHLAWEINVSNAPVKTVYLDSITGDIIATN